MIIGTDARRNNLFTIIMRPTGLKAIEQVSLFQLNVHNIWLYIFSCDDGSFAA